MLIPSQPNSRMFTNFVGMVRNGDWSISLSDRSGHMIRVCNEWTVIDDVTRTQGFGLDLCHCRDARAFTPFSEFPNLGPAFSEDAIGDCASDCLKLAPG